MCGIAGILAPFPPERLRRAALALADAQRHRGPDGAGVQVQGPVALAHRRLSIIDLEAGAQPLSNEDGTIWITFNGEIYNYQELRHTLLQRGHQFRTRSDTEVIVHAYEEWGDGCVQKLRGMFAFAITDTRRHRLFLARDHFGIKPLVYLEQGHWFAFASELQAFHTLEDAAVDLDIRAIDEYLALQYIPAPRTVYRQARKLPPGHTMSVDFDGRVQGPQRYWRPEFRVGVDMPDGEWMELFEATMRDSVRAHLVADVPVGAFLSGGLDSTGVVALAQELTREPVHTYSIGFRDPAHDESAWAREAAERLGTIHHSEMLEVDALDSLSALVQHYGEPFGDSSAVATMAVSRLAARDVKTVLTGDGGDEGMAGYHSHMAWLTAARGAGGEFPARPSVQTWQGMIHYCDPALRAQLWQGNHRGNTLLPIESFEAAWAEARDLGAVQRLQYMDAMTYLPNDILTKVDIASMSASLETRTPLIDVPLWDVLTQMPERLNVAMNPHGTLSGKHMLKRLLSRYFPEPFVHRKKQGFAVPLSRWFSSEGEARHLVDERLMGSGSMLHTLFDPTAARTLLDGGRYGPLWVLLVLEEWLRQMQSHAGAADPLSLASETVHLQESPMAPAERPKVLIVADVPNWIFERHARTLQTLLADEFDITVQYHTEDFDEDAWDLIYVMEFELVPDEKFTQPWKYVTAVRSHVSWDHLAAPMLARFLREHFQQTHVVSQRLHRELVPWLPTITTISHGIDGALFNYAPRPPMQGRPLRVGWAGNRRTAVKGFAEFIEPLAALDGVELVFCGYADRNLTREEMAAWYREVDVYVCASQSEGSNNTLLEAAASGCAIITTDNGTVPEYLRHHEEALIVPRTREAFAAAVMQLRDDEALRHRLSVAASAAVLPAWTWSVKSEAYRAFFRDALVHQDDARRRMASTTHTGRRWILRCTTALEAALAHNQFDEAMQMVEQLMDVDSGNPVWMELRTMLADGAALTAA
ncbi:asparagine synthase (glutamine-hydrolyzing) [Gemmatimonas phototrophica]|uniref:asparagine synthase (glutamine-hydrolyzing) n=1 Tax=Gemmatimonas phototrophica TaxID=1379270 RepID=UPI0006A7574E|nr:asparagine synthase (glutamine-hydrolyzing) [Gemmatimonas phototrophica]